MYRNTPFSDDLIFGIPSPPGDELLTEILLVIFLYYFVVIQTKATNKNSYDKINNIFLMTTIPVATIIHFLLATH